MKIQLVLVFLFPVLANAQQLTLADAIATALKNSLDIRIEKNNIAAAAINNHNSVAGALPNVTLTANDNESVTAVNQKLSNGSNISVSLQANMMLSNGYRVITTKKRLAQLQSLSEQQLNLQIQNTVANVMVKYYDVVRQDYYLKVLTTSIELAQSRLQIIMARKNAGLANNADLFQAEIDVNRSSQEYQTQALILEQAKTDLQSLLLLTPTGNVLVKDTILVDRTLALDSVLALIEQNPALLAAATQVRINEFIEKETAAQRYPALRLNGGYNYNRNQSEAGLFLLNQSYGPFIGLNLVVPIFQGGVVKRQQKIASINTQNAALQQQNLFVQTQTNAVKTWQAYKNVLGRINQEQEAFNLSNQLVSLSLQRLQLGQATILEVREAQRSYEDAAYRLINLNYAGKIAEIELKRLSNKLLF
jgi:outer membrane protein